MSKRLFLLGPCRIADFSGILSEESNMLAIKYNINGTGGTPIVELVKYLVSIKISVTLITLDPNAPSYPVLLKSDDDLLNIFCVRKNRTSSKTFFIFDGINILKVLNKNKNDILLIHSHWPIYSLVPMFFYNEKMLISLHDNAFNCTRFLGLSNVPNLISTILIAFFSKKISVVSSHICNFIGLFRPKLKKHIPVIRNILTIEGKEPDLIKKDDVIKKNIVIIGNKHRLKNILPLLIVLNKLDDLDIAIHVFGPGLDNDYGLEHGLDKTVSFYSSVSHRELVNFIKECDLLIHPSLEEAFPGPIFEAVLLGKPVLCRKVGDLSAIFDGERGVIFYEDEKFILNSIRDVFTKYQLHLTAILELQKIVFDLTNPKNVLDKYICLYNEILDNEDIAYFK